MWCSDSTCSTDMEGAATYCDKGAVEVLLAGGAGPPRVNKEGHSPLNTVLSNAYHINYNPICAGEDKRGLAEVVKLHRVSDIRSTVLSW